MKYSPLVIALTAVLALPAKSEVNSLLTVQDFYLTCEVRLPRRSSQIDDIQFGVCHGFVRGLVEAANLNCAAVGDTVFGKTISANIEDVSIGVITQAMRNWAENNLDVWPASPALLILALAEAWPCAQNQ